MKKLFTLILAFAMVLSLCAAPAHAAGANINNFQKVNTYTNQFSDISGWAVSVIQTCYEYGLMNGKGEGTFAPKGNLTVAEALVMACRVHEIYNTGASTLTNGSPWYQPYVDYAISRGIITAEDFSAYNVNVTRAQMAYIFAGALPAAEFTVLNNVPTLPDVTADTTYSKEIFALYAAGILTGSDAYGTFKPADSITRQEAAAIIARVAIPSMRKTVTLLMDWMPSEDLLVAIPRDASDISNTAGIPMCASETCIVSTNSMSGYPTGITISDAFTVDTLNATLLESYADTIVNGSLDSVLINFGKTPAFRTTCTMLMEGDPYNTVIITVLANGNLHMIFYFVAEDDAQMATLVNNLRINGVIGSPSL